jgi:hypothetical protein
MAKGRSASDYAARLFASVRRPRSFGVNLKETLMMSGELIAARTRLALLTERVKTTLLDDPRDPHRFPSTVHCLGQPS